MHIAEATIIFPTFEENDGLFVLGLFFLSRQIFECFFLFQSASIVVPGSKLRVLLACDYFLLSYESYAQFGTINAR